jgi:hypothetical protein
VWTKGGTKTSPNSASIASIQPTSVPTGRLGGFAGRLFQFGPRQKLQQRLLVRSTLSLARRCSECGTVGRELLRICTNFAGFLEGCAGGRRSAWFGNAKPSNRLDLLGPNRHTSVENPAFSGGPVEQQPY